MKYTVIMRNICNIKIICQIPGPKLKYSNFLLPNQHFKIMVKFT